MTDKSAIIDLEKRFWRTMIDKDADEATAMLAEPCLVAGAHGVQALDRPAFAKLMTEAKWDLRDFTLKDAEVAFPSPDTAVIAYKVSEDLTMDGEKLRLDAADSSVWVRKNGAWLCALHTESPLGDPFANAGKA